MEFFEGRITVIASPFSHAEVPLAKSAKVAKNPPVLHSPWPNWPLLGAFNRSCSLGAPSWAESAQGGGCNAHSALTLENCALPSISCGR